MANLEFRCSNSECEIVLPVNTTGSPFSALADRPADSDPVTRKCECGSESVLVDAEA